LFITNCTNADQIELMLNGLKEGEYQIETLDFLLRPVAFRIAHLASRAELRDAVPQGGLLAITRR
jgi:hypothetical protein